MSIYLRFLSFGSALTAVLVVCVTASVALGYPSRQLGHWLFLLPIVVPLLVAAIAIVGFFFRTNSHLVSGCFWGVFAGANLLLLHQALRLASQNELIRTDGTAYWALLSLPALYGGLATIGVGGVLGLGGGFIVQRLASHGTNQSHALGPAVELVSKGKSSPSAR